MKRTSRALSVASFVAFGLLLAVSTNAHAAPTQTCSYTFTSGSGISYLKFCVTVNGNIAQFESPAGVEQLFSPPGDGGVWEGYGICDGSTNTQYYDYSTPGASGNWGSPTLVSQTATSVKIERTTSDGFWTLTQTITSVAGTTPYAKLAMALKNNSGTTKNANLLRLAGFVPWDLGSGDFTENYAGTNESTFGWLESGTSGHSLYFGLMLQNIGNVTPLSALTANVGYPFSPAWGPPDPCSPFAQQSPGPIINNYGEGVYLYELTIKPGETVTVTDRYLSF